MGRLDPIIRKITLLLLLCIAASTACIAQRNGASSLNTKLIHAVRYGNCSEVKTLIAKGADIDTVTGEGNPLLTEAIVKDRILIATYLIGRGAKLNTLDKSGRSPLIHALLKGDSLTFTTLVTYGADLSAFNNHKWQKLVRFEVAGKKRKKIAESLAIAAYYSVKQEKYDIGRRLLDKLRELPESAYTELDPKVVSSLFECGALLRKKVNEKAAEPYLTLAVEIDRKIVLETNSDVESNLAKLRSKLSEVEKDSDLYTKLKKQLDKAEESWSENRAKLPAHLRMLGAIYYKNKQYSKALPLMKHALELREESLPSNHLLLAESLNDLAVLYYLLGKYQRSIALNKRALEIRKSQKPPRLLEEAESQTNLAAPYIKMGEYLLAEPLLKEALKIRENNLPENDSAIAQSLDGLIYLYVYQNKLDEAALYVERSLNMFQSILPEDASTIINGLIVLARAHIDQGKYDEAESLLSSALNKAKQRFGCDHADVGYIYSNLGYIYYRQREYEKAATTLKKAIPLLERAWGVNDLRLKDMRTAYKISKDITKAERRNNTSIEKDYPSAMPR